MAPLSLVFLALSRKHFCKVFPPSPDPELTSWFWENAQQESTTLSLATWKFLPEQTGCWMSQSLWKDLLCYLAHQGWPLHLLLCAFCNQHGNMWRGCSQATFCKWLGWDTAWLVRTAGTTLLISCVLPETWVLWCLSVNLGETGSSSRNRWKDLIALSEWSV